MRRRDVEGRRKVSFELEERMRQTMMTRAATEKVRTMIEVATRMTIRSSNILAEKGESLAAGMRLKGKEERGGKGGRSSTELRFSSELEASAQ